MNAEATEVQQEQPATAPAEPTALQNVNTAVAKFDLVAAGIADLKAKFAGVVFEVSTARGLKEAREARAAIRDPRYEVERVRKECKKPVIALGKDIDARAERITAELLLIENPIDTQIKAEETRQEEEKKRKAEAERVRVTIIYQRIENIRHFLITYATQPAAEIDAGIKSLVAIPIDDTFGEFKEQAEGVHMHVIAKLRELHTQRLAHEAEQERLKLEREENALQQAENRKERERIAAQQAEAKRKRDAEDAAAKAKRDADEAYAKAKRDAEDAERQRRIDEGMAKLKAEREENERIAAEHKRTAALGEARLQEIMAMGHQVMIASVGRAGVRQGGTRDCIIDTLAETATWEVTEQKFGPLYQMAITARKNACDAIEKLLSAWDEHASAQAAATVPGEFLPPLDRVLEVLPVRIIDPEPFSPKADEIVDLVAGHYRCGIEQARAWCVKAFCQEA